MKLSAQIVDDTLLAAATVTGIPRYRLLGSERFQETCEARFLCWALLREQNFTLRSIGFAFNRHHKAILHGLRRFQDMVAIGAIPPATVSAARKIAGLARPEPDQPGRAAEELLREFALAWERAYFGEDDQDAVKPIWQRAYKFLAGRNQPLPSAP